MGQFMSWKSELLVCAEKYVSCYPVGDVEGCRRSLLRCLQTNNFRDVVTAAVDTSLLANAFVEAGARGHVDVVQAFLDNGINMDVTDNTGWTILIRASSSGKEECVRLLLDHNVNANVETRFGVTALMFATSFVKIVDMFLKKNVDVNIQNNRGWTALMYASRINKREVVQLLLNYGADVDLKDKEGKRALDFATDEEVKELLQNHVNNSYVLK